jgi:hypothetical protein
MQELIHGILEVFEPWGHGGDFLLVILALSVVANNSMFL